MRVNESFAELPRTRNGTVTSVMSFAGIGVAKAPISQYGIENDGNMSILTAVMSQILKLVSN